jgi:hypothetical protein
MSFVANTHGISRDLENKKLRISFTDGEIADVRLDWAIIHDCHEDCNGFIYYVLSTNQSEKYTASSRNAAMWGRFEDIVSIELLGD